MSWLEKYGVNPHYLTLTCDFSSVTSPEISFRYYMFGDDMSNLYFNVYADGAWSNLWLKSGEQQTSNTDPWGKGVVDLSLYGGKKHYDR